jgi:hypothetical protein
MNASSGILRRSFSSKKRGSESMASTDELGKRPMNWGSDTWFRERPTWFARSVAVNRKRRSRIREDDVLNRQDDVSFRRSDFLFRKRVLHGEHVARTIDGDALAIVGVTLGFEEASSCLQTVAFGRKKRHPQYQVTPPQSSA